MWREEWRSCEVCRPAKIEKRDEREGEEMKRNDEAGEWDVEGGAHPPFAPPTFSQKVYKAQTHLYSHRINHRPPTHNSHSDQVGQSALLVLVLELVALWSSSVPVLGENSVVGVVGSESESETESDVDRVDESDESVRGGRERWGGGGEERREESEEGGGRERVRRAGKGSHFWYERGRELVSRVYTSDEKSGTTNLMREGVEGRRWELKADERE